MSSDDIVKTVGKAWHQLTDEQRNLYDKKASSLSHSSVFAVSGRVVYTQYICDVNASSYQCLVVLISLRYLLCAACQGPVSCHGCSDVVTFISLPCAAIYKNTHDCMDMQLVE